MRKRTLAALSLALALASCRTMTGPSDIPSQCGPDFTRPMILKAAQRATMTFSTVPIEELHPRIYEQGCDYGIVIGAGLDAREHIVILIDRSGRVKSFPVCCDLGDCPHLCP